jgi:rhodanese-related sulfurtransferase
LRKAGYTSVHSLAGGTAAWRDASLPIEKSA